MSYQDAFRAAVNAGLTPKGAKSVSEYDDQQAVDSYVAMFWTRYLSESEERWYNFGLRFAKAQAQPESSWKHQVLAEWERSADQELCAALADGFPHLQERLWQKVLGCFRTGTLVVNRCPKCNRVVRTPRARQCLWCGNDWHK
jgi:hypothetical protein